MTIYKRFIARRVEEALSDTPVVLLAGPRRSGKTTFVRALDDANRAYFTLDDPATLDRARTDPVGFLRAIDCATIDEIQRAPELVLPLKKAVDEHYRPGRFLLTGSANVFALPRVADSLAGRVEIIDMLPLAQGEILGRQPTLLDDLFDQRPRAPETEVTGEKLVTAVLSGGFPEVVARREERRKQSWLRSYVSSILSRDLREIASFSRLDDLPQFLRILAETSGQLTNASQIGASINVNHKTAARYISLLQHLFLVETVQPWFSNTHKRLVKTPKLHFLDSGILASLRGLRVASLEADRKPFGALLESFVYAEIRKLMATTFMALTAYHFRDQNGKEVDIVLERDDGMMVGVEIKASATISSSDFAGLQSLAEVAKARFRFGVLLYDGVEVIRYGKHLAAVPLSCLW